MLTYSFDDSGRPSYRAGNLFDMTGRALVEYATTSSATWRSTPSAATEYDVWSSYSPDTGPLWIATDSCFAAHRPSDATPTVPVRRSAIVRSSTRLWR